MRWIKLRQRESHKIIVFVLSSLRLKRQRTCYPSYVVFILAKYLAKVDSPNFKSNNKFRQFPLNIRNLKESVGNEQQSVLVQHLTCTLNTSKQHAVSISPNKFENGSFLHKSSVQPQLSSLLTLNLSSLDAFVLNLLFNPFFYSFSPILTHINFDKRQLFMTDILPNIGLSRLFSNRIRHYLLFLQVTNNIELICQITDYLDIREILNFLSTSRHIHTFGKIHTIEIRLLKAKVDYYERPKMQPTFQTFINFLQIKVPTTQTKLKSQKLARDHECLKKFNQQIRLTKGIKKATNLQPGPTFQKTQLKTSQQIDKTRPQIAVKNQKPRKNISYPNLGQIKESNPQIQKMIKNSLANQKKDYPTGTNPFYQRFQQLEYELARQDFERRKRRRLQQQKEQEQFITMQELKKMAVQDPGARQIVKKIQIEELEKIQRANRDKLKMKPIKIDKNEIQKLRMLQEQQKQKMMVVRQSIAQKLFTNIKSFIRKE